MGFGVKMSDSELKQLFNSLDRDNSRRLRFKEFIDVVMFPPMPDHRRKLVMDTFKRVDMSEDGLISMRELRGSMCVERHPAYRSGQWTKEQCMEEFLDNFDIVGKEDRKVSAEEFMKVYQRISAFTDSDRFFHEKVMEVFGKETPMEKLRRMLEHKGVYRPEDYQKAFFNMEANRDNKMSYEEFKKGIQRGYKLNMSDEEIWILFDSLDKDKSGTLDMEEFLNAVQFPPMPDHRRQLVEQAFHKVAVVTLDGMKSALNFKKHPMVVSGQWTEKQASEHFFEQMDKCGSMDGKVTFEEFMKKYKRLSAFQPSDYSFATVLKEVFEI